MKHSIYRSVFGAVLMLAPAVQAQDFDHALDHGGVALDHYHGEPGPGSADRDDGNHALAPATRAQVHDANRATLQQAYTDLARGDIDAVLAILDPHVMWTDAEGYPYAGTYVGPVTVAAKVFARIGAEWEGYVSEPHTLIAQGGYVVVLGEYRGTYKATGRSVTAPFAHVWQMAGGKVVSFRQFTDVPPFQRAVALHP